MTSVYTAASARTGKRAGERELRASAINRASMKIAGVVQAKILTSSQNASIKRGNESRICSTSKNDFFTRSHRGMRGTRTTTAASTTRVLTAAISELRRRCRRSCSFRLFSRG
ncbi:MAG: hypothetical protein EBX51_05580 [Acidimicrobiia bacterium]|nr:hypothetical protein [Acidimicrobiia bacterium]